MALAPLALQLGRQIRWDARDANRHVVSLCCVETGSHCCYDSAGFVPAKQALGELPRMSEPSTSSAPHIHLSTSRVQTPHNQVQVDPQHFSGNPLERGSDLLRRFDGAGGKDEVSLIVVSSREIVVRAAQQEQSGAVQDLQALLLGANDPDLDLNSEQICLNWADGELHRQLPLYLLGKDKSDRWTFALDITECKTAFLKFLEETCQLDISMADLRSLMPLLSRDACAIAGQAVALSQWHQVHKFCPRCGAPTVTSETGLRRRCSKEPSHKLYPRTDPVVIMLVESPDGRRALLGRNKKFTQGMYTCLSGFIDQCESIEEAVRREVREEARVAVEDVQVVGTQPWPIGRYGSCELMLGCVAKARSYEIMVNTFEMEDVLWYDKEELAAAVKLYDDMLDEPIPGVQQQSLDELGFFIPPPFAIAHHIIRIWAQHEGPWFPPVPAKPPAYNGKL